MKVHCNQKDATGQFVQCEINLYFCNFAISNVGAAFGESMTNSYQCSSSRNPHLLCQSINVDYLLCCQDSSSIEECWLQLESVNYEEIETIALLFECQMSWICFQDNPILWQLCFQGKIFVDAFDLMLYFTFINLSAWLSAKKQAFVKISIFLFSWFRILNKEEAFHKNCTTF